LDLAYFVLEFLRYSPAISLIHPSVASSITDANDLHRSYYWQIHVVTFYHSDK